MFLRLSDFYRWINDPNAKITRSRLDPSIFRFTKHIQENPQLSNLSVLEVKYQHIVNIEATTRVLIGRVDNNKNCLIGIALSLTSREKMNRYVYDIYSCERDLAIRFISAAERLNLIPFISGLVSTVAEIEQGKIVRQSEFFNMRGHFPLDNQKFLSQFLDAKLGIGNDETLRWDIFSEIIGKEKGLFD